MEDLFYSLNPWWEEKYISKDILRDKYMDILIPLIRKKDIIFLTGLRRVGKTTLLHQIISHLLKKVQAKKIFYVSLDMLLLKDYKIYEIVQKYRKLQNLSKNEEIYVFFDEITEKQNFHQELKNLYDLGKVKIFASSSSSTKLKDTSAYLTGRARYIEIDPLDFQEFMKFKNYTYLKKDIHIVENYFEEYMKYGGIPEYVLTKDPLYITELVNNIILKDIVAKHNLKNIEMIFDVFRLLIERIGKPLTYSKISNILGVSRDSVQTYINYFLDTYLFSRIEVRGKLNERIKSPKKFYCGDVGIKNVIHGFKDKGAIFENLVYNKIKKSKVNFIYENGIEIDFFYDNTLLEAKYGQDLTQKQKELFDKIKAKKKLIVNNINFFMN